VEYKGSSGDEKETTTTNPEHLLRPWTGNWKRGRATAVRNPYQHARRQPARKKHKDNNTQEFGHQVQPVDEGGQRRNARRKGGDLKADQEHHRIEAAGAETRGCVHTSLIRLLF